MLVLRVLPTKARQQDILVDDPCADGTAFQAGGQRFSQAQDVIQPLVGPVCAADGPQLKDTRRRIHSHSPLPLSQEDRH